MNGQMGKNYLEVLVKNGNLVVISMNILWIGFFCLDTCPFDDIIKTFEKFRKIRRISNYMEFLLLFYEGLVFFYKVTGVLLFCLLLLSLYSIISEKCPKLLKSLICTIQLRNIYIKLAIFVCYVILSFPPTNQSLIVIAKTTIRGVTAYVAYRKYTTFYIFLCQLQKALKEQAHALNLSEEKLKQLRRKVRERVIIELSERDKYPEEIERRSFAPELPKESIWVKIQKICTTVWKLLNLPVKILLCPLKVFEKRQGGPREEHKTLAQQPQLQKRSVVRIETHGRVRMIPGQYTQIGTVEIITE